MIIHIIVKEYDTSEIYNLVGFNYKNSHKIKLKTYKSFLVLK